jgi:hypothetical protein
LGRICTSCCYRDSERWVRFSATYLILFSLNNHSISATAQMILLPGNNFTSAATFVSNGSADALAKVKNPDGSITGLIFDVHKYLDYDNSGTNQCVSRAPIPLSRRSLLMMLIPFLVQGMHNQQYQRCMGSSSSMAKMSRQTSLQHRDWRRKCPILHHFYVSANCFPGAKL